jgi:hypothetical protein
MLYESRHHIVFHFKEAIRQLRRYFQAPQEEPEMEENLIDHVLPEVVQPERVEHPLPAMGSNDDPIDIQAQLLIGTLRRRIVDHRPPEREPEQREARENPPRWGPPILPDALRVRERNAANAYFNAALNGEDQNPLIRLNDGEQMVVGPYLRAKARRIIYLILASHPMSALEHNPARKVHVFEDCNGRVNARPDFVTRNYCRCCIDRFCDHIVDRLFNLLHISGGRIIPREDIIADGCAEEFIDQSLVERGYFVHA